jgi:hypothetical protein
MQGDACHRIVVKISLEILGATCKAGLRRVNELRLRP